MDRSVLHRAPSVSACPIVLPPGDVLVDTCAIAKGGRSTGRDSRVNQHIRGEANFCAS